MTRIIAIQTDLMDIPAIRPHVLTMATMNVQTLCLVRRQCDDGVERLGASDDDRLAFLRGDAARKTISAPAAKEP